MARRSSGATLWYLDSAKTLHAVHVQTVLTDGQRTEVRGPGLVEGLAVVTSAPVTGEPAAEAPTANPLQPQRRGGPRGF